MANGMFNVPLHCVLFDDNWLTMFLPSNLLSKGQKEAVDGRWEPERFSLIIFCRFGRKGVQGHGKYNGTWRKERKKEIDTIAKDGQVPQEAPPEEILVNKSSKSVLVTGFFLFLTLPTTCTTVSSWWTRRLFKP